MEVKSGTLDNNLTVGRSKLCKRSPFALIAAGFLGFQKELSWIDHSWAGRPTVTRARNLTPITSEFRLKTYDSPYGF